MSPKKKVTGRGPRRVVTSQRPQQTANEKYLAYRRGHRRRALAGALFVLAGLVVVSHWFEHLGLLRLMNPSAQDLFVGYPTAAVLAVIGGVLWGV